MKEAKDWYGANHRKVVLFSISDLFCDDPFVCYRSAAWMIDDLELE